MTRGELFNMAYQGFGGAPQLFQPAASSYDRRFLGGNDLGSLPVTPDDEVLAQNWQIQQLAHQANMQGQANEGKKKIALLQRMLSNPYTVNTAAPATSPDESDFQRIIQEDVNARERGARLGLAGEQRKAKERQQSIALNLQIRKQALAEAAAQERANQGRARIDQGDVRLDQGQQGLDRRYNQDDFRAMSNDEKEAMGMLDDGIPLGDVIKDNPHLPPQTRAKLYSYAQALLQQDTTGYGQDITTAQGLNQQLAAAEAKAHDDYKKSLVRNWWPDKGYDQSAEDAYVQARMAPVYAQIRKEKRDKGLTYNTEMDSFMPSEDNPRSTPYARSISDYERRVRSRMAPIGPPVPPVMQRRATGIDRASLPIVTSPSELAMLNYGDKFIGGDGQVHQNLPRGVMFGR